MYGPDAGMLAGPRRMKTPPSRPLALEEIRLVHPLVDPYLHHVPVVDPRSFHGDERHDVGPYVVGDAGGRGPACLVQILHTDDRSIVIDADVEGPSLGVREGDDSLESLVTVLPLEPCVVTLCDRSAILHDWISIRY